MKTVYFNYKKEANQNPYIGFTSFQHFRNDELYSDLIVLPENNMTETEHVECYPVPDYVEEKGREQGYYPDCSVVYIRILWKEFEPKQGEYNYSFIEDIFKKAEDNKQTVMFRLMPHSTRNSDDVPDWVKEIIECPDRPIGKREKTSPSDPRFLELFGNAVKNIGEKFDSNPTLAFMDVSLPGAWGEGSSCNLFLKEDLKHFADRYTSSYKKTLLIGQIGEPWIVSYMCESAPIGWRADCIGNPWSMEKYVPNLMQTIDGTWKNGHISFEAYWWISEWQRKGWNIDEIIETTLNWHISTFNAKSLPIPFKWKDKIEYWVSKMGYHFVIDKAVFTEKVTVGNKLSLHIEIDNIGVAPIYHRIPLCVKLKNESVEKVFNTDVDITKWIEGKYNEDIIIDLPTDLKPDKYSLQIGVCGENYPTVHFATDGEQDCDYTVLGEMIIV